VVGRISVPDARVYELSVSQLERLSLQLWRVLSDSFARDRTDGQN